jgi:hypothetical protein
MLFYSVCSVISIAVSKTVTGEINFILVVLRTIQSLLCSVGGVGINQHMEI